MIEKHESENVLIHHVKKDRINEEKIDCKDHLRFDIFPKENKCKPKLFRFDFTEFYSNHLF